MPVIADLHIHSRFSRATSKQLTPRHLAAWAQCKGIHILGTGDFTHPQWRAELQEQLCYDEETGLYTLNVSPETLPILEQNKNLTQQKPFFCLQTEISSIYKRHGKVRKVHSLVFVPTLDDAEKLSQRLSHIGNLNSDGRPILGLDAKDLLEIVLEISPQAVLVPAHIWTPWFSLFGSKSGFDRIEECFEDLSSHIFALETGLSSDPAMNRLISHLDRYALISNSDAHSGANLGREANLFDGKISYQGMFDALRTVARRQDQSALDCRFMGTMEFYPEEGKYHLDGHRACNISLEPQEAQELGNICPVCGKPLTIGVLHRVWELADRKEPAQLLHEPVALPLIPLPEIISEILGVGSTSQKVQQRYTQLLATLGSELDILCHLPEHDIRQHWEPLGEAIHRMRSGRVYRQGGFDGEYGTVRVFSPEEQNELHGSSARRKTLVNLPRRAAKASQARQTSPAVSSSARQQDSQPPVLCFSEQQQQALVAGPHPVLVLAGPGSGKTRILVGRMEHLLKNGTDPEQLVALTFTRRAAAEMKTRLGQTLPQQKDLPHCDTLHGYAWGYIRNAFPSWQLLPEDNAFLLFIWANCQLSRQEARQYWDRIQFERERLSPPAMLPPTVHEALLRYNEQKHKDNTQHYLDYADLPLWLLWLQTQQRNDLAEEHDRAQQWLAESLLQTHSPLLCPQHILVDEAQDLSPVQFALVRALLPRNGQGFFGIGDPDQAIYSFRGAEGQNEQDFRHCWPQLQVLRLGVSYRASQSVLDMAQHLLHGKTQCGPLVAAQTDKKAFLRLFQASSEYTEARWIAQHISRLIGATSHTLLDGNRQESTDLDGCLSPSDVAVLVRLKRQIPPLQQALEKAGIPCAVPEKEPFWKDSFCASVLAQANLGEAADISATEAEETIQLPQLPRHGTELLAPAELADWLEQHMSQHPSLQGDAWKELCQRWQKAGSWRLLLEQIALAQEADAIRERAEYVQIMTLHASKGLEFQAVFIPGLEQGLIPLQQSALGLSFGNNAESNEDEERRLLYVGLTRAAQAIFTSFAKKRTLYGRELHLAPSSFITLISEFCRKTALAPHVRKQQTVLSLLE